VPAGPNAYNSLWQVRTDAWSALEESTAQLELAGTQQRPVEQLTDAVAEALDVLAPIERFWAFPGMQASYRVRRGSHTSDADVEEEAYDRVEAGEQVVSTTYVTPYPPGFPVLVPGQVFSPQILAFMGSLDTPEVHGYRPDLGYRVYVDKALEIAATNRPAPPPDAAGSAASTSPDAP
jgi:arginine/lysine/ornithine decarboxylase